MPLVHKLTLGKYHFSGEVCRQRFAFHLSHKTKPSQGAAEPFYQLRDSISLIHK